MIIRTTTLIGLCTMLALLCARGAVLEMDVPFAFKADRIELPAGHYAFSSSEDGRDLAIKYGRTKEVHLPVLSRLQGPSPAAEGTAIFARIDGANVLSEVWIIDLGGFQVANLPRTAIPAAVRVVNVAASRLSGKEIFDQTCCRCHGPEGQGNPDADKFFKKKIPRLVSDYVQSKSDAELREIISNGRREMDPVRIGEAGMRHYLEPESIDGVIGYIRTLNLQKEPERNSDTGS